MRNSACIMAEVLAMPKKAISKQTLKLKTYPYLVTRRSLLKREKRRHGKKKSTF